ncbi:hypothetical protein C8R45DRAFT_1096668 [Mycena sanguinolenta]|nr:hypothetical protein C8R45DRAFT_1096668 [Mycena sanguinolenta]
MAPPNTPTVSAICSSQRVPAPVLLPLVQTPFHLQHYPTPLALSRFPMVPSTDSTSTGPRNHAPGDTPTRAPVPARVPVPAATRALVPAVPAVTRAQAPVATRAPTPAYAPPPPRVPTPIPLSPLTEEEDEDKDAGIIKRPPHAGLFEGLFTVRQDRLDWLAAIHLDKSRILAAQDRDDVAAIHNAMLKDFAWLDRCPEKWPISVSLRALLHNSARNITKSNKKVITLLNGKRPPKTTSHGPSCSSA